MSVVATASNPNDATPAVFTDLPIASVALTGAGAGGSGTFTTWQWILLDKPTGSAATISDSSLQSPTLDNVDLWGNYRLMLVVTDDLGESSEADRNLAPDSAFTVVRVTSEHAAIQKPAAGERNTDDILDSWAELLDDLKEHDEDHTIASHSDTSATGAELTTLTDGSDATGLHQHNVSDILGGGGASTATAGFIKTATDPVDPANPKAVTEAKVPLQAHCEISRDSTGFYVGKIVDQSAGGRGSIHAHAFWEVLESTGLRVRGFSVTFADGGDTGSYRVRLYKVTWAQLSTNDYASGTLIHTLTIASNAYAPTKGSNSAFAAVDVAQGQYLAALVDQVPTNPGGPMAVQVDCRQRF